MEAARVPGEGKDALPVRFTDDVCTLGAATVLVLTTPGYYVWLHAGSNALASSHANHPAVRFWLHVTGTIADGPIHHT